MENAMIKEYCPGKDIRLEGEKVFAQSIANDLQGQDTGVPSAPAVAPPKVENRR
jgi:hypothetical protein